MTLSPLIFYKAAISESQEHNRTSWLLSLETGYFDEKFHTAISYDPNSYLLVTKKHLFRICILGTV